MGRSPGSQAAPQAQGIPPSSRTPGGAALRRRCVGRERRFPPELPQPCPASCCVPPPLPALRRLNCSTGYFYTRASSADLVTRISAWICGSSVSLGGHTAACHAGALPLSGRAFSALAMLSIYFAAAASLWECEQPPDLTGDPPRPPVAARASRALPHQRSTCPPQPPRGKHPLSFWRLWGGAGPRGAAGTPPGPQQERGPVSITRTGLDIPVPQDFWPSYPAKFTGSVR